MATDGVCIERWYIMIIFSSLTQTACVDAFRWAVGLFDGSKGYFNRQSLKAVVRSQVVLYLIVFKKKI